ncbi:MAG: hypothetical protein AAF206_03545 [Bacteroidota bacterium]
MPKPGQIRRHQDFDSLYDRYQVTTRFEFWRSLYRNPRYFAGLVAILSIVFLIFDQNQEKPTVDEPLINPPFAKLDPAFMRWEMMAGEPFTFHHPNGAEVFIPAHSFVDAWGDSVCGGIQVRYRELNDPGSLFLSGLPLAGGEQPVNTQNIAQIEAFQYGIPLEIRSGKSIELVWEMPPVESDLMVFQLDTAGGTWQAAGLAEQQLLAVNDVRPAIPSILTEVTDELVPRAAIPPHKPGRPFGVRLKNKADHPEFRAYQKTYWSWIDGHDSANPWEDGLILSSGEQIWEDVRIRKLGGEKAYELTFMRAKDGGGVEIRKVTARAIFEARNQTQANTIYQQQLEDYQRELAAWEAARTAKREREEARRKAKRQYDQAIAAWEAGQADSAAQAGQSQRRVIIHSLGIHRLGIANDADLEEIPVILTKGEREVLSLQTVRAHLLQYPTQQLYPGRIQGDTIWIPRPDPNGSELWLSRDAKEFARIVWPTGSDGNVPNPIRIQPDWQKADSRVASTIRRSAPGNTD